MRAVPAHRLHICKVNIVRKEYRLGIAFPVRRKKRKLLRGLQRKLRQVERAFVFCGRNKNGGRVGFAQVGVKRCGKFMELLKFHGKPSRLRMPAKPQEHPAECA